MSVFATDHIVYSTTEAGRLYPNSGFRYSFKLPRKNTFALYATCQNLWLCVVEPAILMYRGTLAVWVTSRGMHWSETNIAVWENTCRVGVSSINFGLLVASLTLMLMFRADDPDCLLGTWALRANYDGTAMSLITDGMRENQGRYQDKVLLRGESDDLLWLAQPDATSKY